MLAFLLLRIVVSFALGNATDERPVEVLTAVGTRLTRHVIDEGSVGTVVASLVAVLRFDHLRVPVLLLDVDDTLVVGLV